MIKFNDFTKENLKEDNLNWPQIRDDPYRIVIHSFNLVSHQPDIDEFYLYAKDPFERKYQLLINKRQKTGL